ncbi:hypothetical protein [Moorena bouillonii]|nr:hypothetical protein [Moorena bouillonii]
MCRYSTEKNHCQPIGIEENTHVPKTNSSRHAHFIASPNCKPDTTRLSTACQFVTLRRETCLCLELDHRSVFQTDFYGGYGLDNYLWLILHGSLVFISTVAMNYEP